MFVADFVGESNMLRGRLERDGDGTWLQRGEWRWRVDPAVAGAPRPAATARRRPSWSGPEHLRVAALDAPRDGANSVEATVTEVLYLGSTPQDRAEAARRRGRQSSASRPATAGDWRPGDKVRLEWSVERAVVVPDPATTGETPPRTGDVGPDDEAPPDAAAPHDPLDI